MCKHQIINGLRRFFFFFIKIKTRFLDISFQFRRQQQIGQYIVLFVVCQRNKLFINHRKSDFCSHRHSFFIGSFDAYF
ncbi:MAG: DUF559 domain-containing protein [Prevotellaceae bacterium]|nr:DUF559 domain-containing protein [Prevotellaceae bacterium]